MREKPTPLCEQLVHRLAGAIIERIRVLNRTAYRTHVLFGPVDSQRLVDGRVEVAHTDTAVGDIVATLIAGAHHLARLDAAAGECERPAVGPMIAAEVGVDYRRA